MKMRYTVYHTDGTSEEVYGEGLPSHDSTATFLNIYTGGWDHVLIPWAAIKCVKIEKIEID